MTVAQLKMSGMCRYKTGPEDKTSGMCRYKTGAEDKTSGMCRYKTGAEDKTSGMCRYTTVGKTQRRRHCKEPRPTDQGRYRRTLITPKERREKGKHLAVTLGRSNHYTEGLYSCQYRLSPGQSQHLRDFDLVTTSTKDRL